MHTVPDEQSKMEMGLPTEAPRTSGISETQRLNCEKKIILIVSFITDYDNREIFKNLKGGIFQHFYDITDYQII